ncbi:uncharacterized protein [Rutidosis leptorrhynchoides]|uniref:uncharacterized protein n=1 Tax=Rutidosis leptorrhynchoides TaxID=125765 RepID=UPI003A98EA0D
MDGGLGSKSNSFRAPYPGIWHNIILAGNVLEDIGITFRSSFYKTVRDGSSTSFWRDNWIGEGRLCNLFPRLFRLEKFKEALVKDRIDMTAPTLATCFDWSRHPTGRTATELNNLIILLTGYTFDQSRPDTWSWTLSQSGRFTVKELSYIIDEHALSDSFSSQATLRNKLVPKKLEIFAWRASRKRLPVRVELDKRGIDLHSIRCPLCDDDLETTDHTLVFCKHAIEVWNRVYGWWGLGNFANFSTYEIFKGITPVHMSPLGKEIFQAVEWTCAYFIWRNRNNLVFRGKMWNAPIALNEIQVRTFEWISHLLKGKRID